MIQTTAIYPKYSMQVHQKISFMKTKTGVLRQIVPFMFRVISNQIVSTLKINGNLNAELKNQTKRGVFSLLW